MNVLSFFDGISCGQIALNRIGIIPENYYACEIKSHAIKCTQKNYPNTKQLGDVRNVHYTKIGIEVDLQPNQVRFIEQNIDLFIGGSPCKGISTLNQKQQGLEHKESILFYEWLRVLREIQIENPNVKFLLENTHGNKIATDTITKELGVKPISINSRLVSAQNRPRYYWTNIPGVTQPKDKNITTKDVFDFSGNLVDECRVKWLKSESGKKSIEIFFKLKMEVITLAKDLCQQNRVINQFIKTLKKIELEITLRVGDCFLNIL
jgi:site-specific DNA-cytosine methylase